MYRFIKFLLLSSVCAYVSAFRITVCQDFFTTEIDQSGLAFYVPGVRETVFYDDNWRVTKTVTPKKGNAILFDIDLWHMGNPVTRGAKYWIGCEIIGKF
jgi:hypothetical protein